MPANKSFVGLANEFVCGGAGGGGGAIAVAILKPELDPSADYFGISIRTTKNKAITGLKSDLAGLAGGFRFWGQLLRVWVRPERCLCSL